MSYIVIIYQVSVHVEISASMVSSGLDQIRQLLFWPLNCVYLNPRDTISTAVVTASTSDDQLVTVRHLNTTSISANDIYIIF